MITAGVDVGNKFTKVVIIKDGKILSRSIVESGFNQGEAAHGAYCKALSEAGITRADVQYVMSTGAGKGHVYFSSGTVTEVSAGARGANYLFPTGRLIIDVGSEESRAVKCDGRGRVLDFAINEKCAAGAGSFTEAMSRALEVTLDEMGPLSLKSTRSIPINAQCVVFAESEVVSMIHSNIPKEDICRAVHDAIASRIISMARRVGVEKDLVMTGGMGRNAGFVKSLGFGLGMDVLVTGDPEFVSAMGAAIAGAEKAEGLALNHTAGGKPNGS